MFTVDVKQQCNATPSVDLTQYEIFRAKVCNFWQGNINLAADCPSAYKKCSFLSFYFSYYLFVSVYIYLRGWGRGGIFHQFSTL